MAPPKSCGVVGPHLTNRLRVGVPNDRGQPLLARPFPADRPLPIGYRDPTDEELLRIADQLIEGTIDLAEVRRQARASGDGTAAALDPERLKALVERQPLNVCRGDGYIKNPIHSFLPPQRVSNAVYTYRLDLARDVLCSTPGAAAQTQDLPGIRLSPEEAEALIDLGTMEYGRVCRKADAPGAYRITDQSATVLLLYKTLTDPSFSDPRITETRRQEIVAALEGLPAVSQELRSGRMEANGERVADKAEKTAFWSRLGAIVGMITGFGILYYFRKSSRQQEGILGKEKIKDPLKRYGRNLTEMARRGEFKPYVGQDALMKEIALTFGREDKPNVYLSGRAGVGKTATMREFVRRAATGTLPAEVYRNPTVAARLKDIEFHEFRPERIQEDGVHLVGKMSEKFGTFRRAVEARKAKGQNVGIIIDEAHLLNTVGKGMNTEGLIEYVKTWLTDSKVPIILGSDRTGEITSDEAVAGRGRAFEVLEPTPAATVAILREAIPHYADQHVKGRAIAPDLAEAIVRKVPPAFDGNGNLIANPRRSIDALEDFLIAQSTVEGDGEITAADYERWVDGARRTAAAEETALADRLTVLRAGTDDPRTVAVLERMLQDIRSREGKGRVKTLLAYLEDPGLVAEGIDRAEREYRLRPIEGPYTALASGRSRSGGLVISPQVCRMPEAADAFAEGVRAMASEIVPQASPPPGDPLEARLEGVAAILGPELYARMKANLATTDGRAMVSAMVMLMENPLKVQRERGLDTARFHYGQEMGGTGGGEAATARPAVPVVEGGTLMMAPLLSTEVLRGAVERPSMDNPETILARTVVSEAKVVAARPVETPIGRGKK